MTASTDIRFYSRDSFGNSEAVKAVSYTILSDTTPPTTTPEYPSGTYAPFYAWLSCNDGSGSGCAGTYYCLGSGCNPDTLFNGAFTISSSTDLRYHSVDRDGNWETVKTVSYTIDSTPPTTTATPGGGIYASPRSVVLSCDDGSGSGCANIYYCQGIDCWPSTKYTGPINIASSTYLNFSSRDNAGNDEPRRTARYTILNAEPSTIHVPGEVVTIQGAIDAAQDGDTVVVAPGTYVEHINFSGKAITVRSSGGVDKTILDGNQAGTVVTFDAYEWRTSTLQGFTIQNGLADFEGGGIAVAGASPTITDNRIIANGACNGGGISIYGGTALIQRNVISHNNRSGCFGGGGGGGIYIAGGAVEIVENKISNNELTDGDGGGIYMFGGGTPTIRGNTIKDNSTLYEGGGIMMVNQSDALIVQNVITGNRAGKGGGISWLTPSGTRGPYLVNNTIIDNDSAQGSGVYADGYDANTLLVNNIIVSIAGQSAIHCGDFNDLNPPQFRHNLVYSPSGSAYGGTCTDQNGTKGNITADPLFYIPSPGSYYLTARSPALDAGDNGAPSLPSLDIMGKARIVDGNNDGTAVIDIGAQEFQVPLTINDSDPYTRSASVKLSLNFPGAAAMQISVDGGTTWGPWGKYVSTKSVKLAHGDGLKTVSVRFKYADGAVSNVYSATITLDATAPTKGTLTITPSAGAFTLHWDGFNDTMSGIAGYRLVMGTAIYTACTAKPLYEGTDTSYVHAGVVSGKTYYYRVCAVDNAGKISVGATAKQKAP
jgi:parallel beta-helix repeat protein